MSLVGTPSEWVDLIDTMVPDILDLVVATWGDIVPLAPNALENPTTEALCRLLRLNRNSSDLPFQIQIQMVELDPAADQDQGRMDIAFCPMVPRENIYFALECKRLHANKDGKFSSFTYFDTSAFMNAMHRQRLVEGNDGRLIKTTRKTRAREPVDRLFAHNIDVMRTRVEPSSRQSYQRVLGTWP